MISKRGAFVVGMLVLALLLMGNSPGLNAFCLGKEPGNPCTVTGLGCYAAAGTCQHVEGGPTGFHDDPNTPEDEALLCITGETNPASPLESTQP